MEEGKAKQESWRLWGSSGIHSALPDPVYLTLPTCGEVAVASFYKSSSESQELARGRPWDQGSGFVSA